jgi:hypothetical protein
MWALARGASSVEACKNGRSGSVRRVVLAGVGQVAHLGPGLEMVAEKEKGVSDNTFQFLLFLYFFGEDWIGLDWRDQREIDDGIEILQRNGEEEEEE